MKLLARISHRRITITLMAAALGLVYLNASPGASASTSEGLECATDAHNKFSLTAEDVYVSTPDGNSIYMWSYGLSSGKFQLPGPTLCVTSGETVTVVLHNTLPEDTSIVFPGQSGVQADGNPAQPQMTDTGAMTSMVQAAEAKTGSVTYTFKAGSPGT